MIERIKELGFTLLQDEMINGGRRVDFELQLNGKAQVLFTKRLYLSYLVDSETIIIQTETSGYSCVFSGCVQSIERLEILFAMCVLPILEAVKKNLEAGIK